MSSQDNQPDPNFQPTYSGAASTPDFVNGTPDWVQPIIAAAAAKYNIPTMLLSALLKQESGFDPNAQSPVGASGIAQFMPATAQSYGVNPSDPNSAIDGAAHYLSDAKNVFGPDWKKVIASYNAGIGAVQQYDGVPPYQETQNYVKNILSMAGDPHQSANGPYLDLMNNMKDQSQKNNSLNVRPQDNGGDYFASVVNQMNNQATPSANLNTPSANMSTPSFSQPNPPQSQGPTPATQSVNYTVKPGDTLSSIGQRYGVPYQQISGYSSNNPNVIFPGENLKIK